MCNYAELVESLNQSFLVHEAVSSPLHGAGTGHCAGVGVAAVELCLQDLAHIGSGGACVNVLACLDSSLERAVDRVNAVVSGSAELVERVSTELSGVLVNEGLSSTLGCTCGEVGEHGDLLGNGSDIKALSGSKAVEAVAAVVGSDAGLVLSLVHKQSRGSVVNGHEDELAVLESSDLGGEVRGGLLGEGSLNHGDGGAEVRLELGEDALGVVVVRLVEHADLGKVQAVHVLSGSLTLLRKATRKHKITVTELSKYPEVKRDLALLVDKGVNFSALRAVAFAAEKKLLKSVALFDVYEGDKLPEGKKSYALSFVLEDKSQTLTDKAIERTMASLQAAFEKQCGASIR